VLANHETRGAIEKILGVLQATGDISLIGSPTAGEASTPQAGVNPELAIAVDPEMEKAAYLAYENGTPLDDLLDAPVEKKRYDEALLLREFDGSSGRPKNPAAKANENSSDTVSEKPEPPPLVDRTLQRAVNTAIALKALRKI
jgi:fermentation-respiration switch protein FrsA (DUF1100 family)